MNIFRARDYDWAAIEQSLQRRDHTVVGDVHVFAKFIPYDTATITWGERVLIIGPKHRGSKWKYVKDIDSAIKWLKERL